jgi:hypothetical protein
MVAADGGGERVDLVDVEEPHLGRFDARWLDLVARVAGELLAFDGDLAEAADGGVVAAPGGGGDAALLEVVEVGVDLGGVESGEGERAELGEDVVREVAPVGVDAALLEGVGAVEPRRCPFADGGLACVGCDVVAASEVGADGAFVRVGVGLAGEGLGALLAGGVAPADALGAVGCLLDAHSASPSIGRRRRGSRGFCSAFFARFAARQASQRQPQLS